MTRPVALVTGGSRGIGAAVARMLGTRGYDVCVNYRQDRDSADGVVADLAAMGSNACAVRADVAVMEDVERLFTTMDLQLGTVSALVNNAGIIGPHCTLEELSLEAFNALMATNVTGLLHCSQQAIRRMSTAKGGNGGAIVNLSSGSAHIGNPGNGVHYAMSKGAVNSLTIGLSQEVAALGIRVNAVSPGMTRTEMPSRTAIEASLPAIPMQRIGEPEEIAEAVAWLLSDRASYTSGANIRVSGGRP